MLEELEQRKKANFWMLYVYFTYCQIDSKYMGNRVQEIHNLIHTGQANIYKDQQVFRSQIYKERRCNMYLYEDVITASVFSTCQNTSLSKH